MRGAGKTSLGQAAAAALGWQFVDLDWHLEARCGQKVSDFVAAEGWPAFRRKELETLRQVLRESPTRTVVACGGGIVETPEALAVLKAWYPVVHICKPIEDVEEALSASTGRAQLAEPPRSIFARRLPLYESCSDYDFHLRLGDHDWEGLRRDFAALAQRVTGLGPRPRFDEDSFVLPLAVPDVAQVLPLLPGATQGADAVELRVDLLSSQEPGYVSAQLAALRRATDLPIVFALRSGEGRDPGAAASLAAALLPLGLRAACEFVEVEADLPPPVLRGLLERQRCSRLIGSLHRPKCGVQRRSLQMCTLGGAAEMVRVTVGTSCPEDVVSLHHVARAERLPVPHAVVHAGSAGRISSVLNRVFTPVTHPLLPAEARGEQMSAREIMEARKALGYCSPRDFYIFGKPVALSPSPTIHTAGFAVNATPHRYGRLETDIAEVAHRALMEPGCGGGSVTIPLKETLLPYMSSLSEPAKQIGAINTVTKMPDGSLAGDNTDWLGIKRQFERKLKALGRPSVTDGKCIALVLGAGGTARAACYAFRSMGCSTVLIHNRTHSRAEAIAEQLGAQACHMAHLASLPRLDFVMGTLPGTAQVDLPAALWRFQPIVLDAAYRPRDTPLLQLARANRCPTLEGAEMLFEQGCAQCEIWTRRRAPRADIAAAFAGGCFAGEEVPEGLRVEAEAAGLLPPPGT